MQRLVSGYEAGVHEAVQGVENTEAPAVATPAAAAAAEAASPGASEQKEGLADEGTRRFSRSVHWRQNCLALCTILKVRRRGLRTAFRRRREWWDYDKVPRGFQRPAPEAERVRRSSAHGQRKDQVRNINAKFCWLLAHSCYGIWPFEAFLAVSRNCSSSAAKSPLTRLATAPPAHSRRYLGTFSTLEAAAEAW